MGYGDNIAKQSFIKPLILIVIVFILSRVIFFNIGIRFDSSVLGAAWQYADPELLKHNLLQTIYYFHSQPPLFNLFLGIILKMFPQPSYYTLIFHLVYMVFGLILAISVFLVMVRLEVPIMLSVFLAVIFIINPSAILFENLLFYTYPVTALLCLSAFFLHRFQADKKLLDGIIFFILLSSIVLIRNLFPIWWFLLFCITVFLCNRRIGSKVIISFCIPLLLILFLYLKNFYIFGTFNSSSCLGMTLSQSVTFLLPEEQRRLLVSQGRISKFSLIMAYSGLEADKDYLPEIKESSIAILSQRKKSTGANNFNHIAYVGISKRHLKDAISILFLHPEVYLKSLPRKFFTYFLPSSEFWYFRKNSNYRHIQGWNRFYNIIFYGKFFRYNTYRGDKESIVLYYAKKFMRTSFFLLIGFLVLGFYGWRFILYSLSKKITDTPSFLTILFLLINVIYVTLTSNLLSIFDNQRYRFMIDPFILVLLGLFLKDVFIINRTSTRLKP
jgi:hypothetical protein